MAAPFVVLGLKGVNKAIDAHFEKVPDPYLHIHPKKRRQARENIQARQAGAAGAAGAAGSRDSQDQSRSPSPASDYGGRRGINERDEAPFGEQEYAEDRYQYSDTRNPRYDQDPRYATRSSIPDRRVYEDDYEERYTPQSARGYDDGGRYERDRQREIEYGSRSVRDERYTPGPDYASAYGVSTASLPPSRSRPQYRSRSSEDGRRSPISTISKRSKSTNREKVALKYKEAKNKVDETDQKIFSSTDKGLGALSVGALIGGIAAYKVGKAGKGGKHSIDPVLAGILGAAVVGLGANAGEKIIEKKMGTGSERRTRDKAEWESEDDDDYGDSRDRYDDRDSYGGRERRRSSGR